MDCGAGEHVVPGVVGRAEELTVDDGIPAGEDVRRASGSGVPRVRGPRLRRSLSAAIPVVFVAACSGGDGDTVAPEGAQARVLELRELAVDVTQAPADRLRPPSMVESLICDDTGDPTEAGLVRATAGQEVTVPGSGSSELARSASERLADAQRWSRVVSPIGDGWEVTSDDGYRIFVRSVEPGVLSVRVTGPCQEAG